MYKHNFPRIVFFYIRIKVDVIEPKPKNTHHFLQKKKHVNTQQENHSIILLQSAIQYIKQHIGIVNCTFFYCE